MSEKIVDMLMQIVNFVNIFQTCFVYYIGLRPRKFSRLKAWGISSLVLFAGSVFLRYIIGFSLPVYIGFIFLVNGLLVLGMYRCNVKAFIQWILIQYLLISFPAEVITVMLTTLLQKRTDTYVEATLKLYVNSEISVIGRQLANIIFMVLIVFLLIGKGIIGRRRHNWKNYFLLLAIPVYQVILCIVYFLFCGTVLTVPIIVVGYLMAIFSIVIDFAVIIVIENMNERIDREEEFNGLEIMRKRELVYLEQNMQQTEALRLVRHDLGNQLQTLSAMLEEKTERNIIMGMFKEVKDRIATISREGE